jgi:hypothetical protein
VSGEDEAAGLDLTQHAEVGYVFTDRGGSLVQSPVLEASAIARGAVGDAVSTKRGSDST